MCAADGSHGAARRRVLVPQGHRQVLCGEARLRAQRTPQVHED